METKDFYDTTRIPDGSPRITQKEHKGRGPGLIKWGRDVDVFVRGGCRVLCEDHRDEEDVSPFESTHDTKLTVTTDTKVDKENGDIGKHRT